MSKPEKTEANDAGISALGEVRYSLPDLLRELKVERAAGSFSMERLDQAEIGKLFKAKSIRRGKPKPKH